MEIQSATKPEPETPAAPPARGVAPAREASRRGRVPDEGAAASGPRSAAGERGPPQARRDPRRGRLPLGHRPRTRACAAERRRCSTRAKTSRRSCDQVVSEQSIYQVFEISYEPHYKAHEVVYESASFLEAVEFAAEHIEDADPDGHRDPAHERRDAGDGLDVQRQPCRRCRRVATGPHPDVRLRPHAVGRSYRPSPPGLRARARTGRRRPTRRGASTPCVRRPRGRSPSAPHAGSPAR